MMEKEDLEGLVRRPCPKGPVGGRKENLDNVINKN